jgi:DNA invertase Pin-like site-specific DNA recombinase
VRQRQRQHVAYYRVSTPRQVYSGLGLEAQREAVLRYVGGVSGKLVAEFTEVKSGRKGARPQLAEAIRTCRMRRAVLVIARLDRLARNVALIADLMDSELEFVAVDFPTATRLTLHVLAAIAEYESKLVSERTKAALAVAKARGVRLGGPRSGFTDLPAAVAASVKTRKAKALASALDVAPIIWEMLAEGRTQKEIAAELTRRLIPSPRKSSWDATGVGRVMRLTRGALPLLAKGVDAAPDWRTVRAAERAGALAPLVWGLWRQGLSLTSLAEEMNRRQIATPRGRGWHTSTVFSVLRLTKTPGIEENRAKAIGRRSANARRRALDLAPLVKELRKRGMTYRAIAQEFNERGVRSGRGGLWGYTSVRDILVLADKAQLERIGKHRRKAFRSPPLDPKARVMEAAPRIWQLRARGQSAATIAGELNRQQVKSPKWRRWHKEAVERVLQLTAGEFPHHAKVAASAANPWMAHTRERAAKLAPLVRELRATMTLKQVAAEMMRRGVPSPKGSPRWWLNTVRKVLKRAEEAEAASMPVRVRRARSAPSLAPNLWPLRLKATA